MVSVSKALRIVVALATVLILIFLAFNCIDIYLEGNSPANLSESGVHLSPVFSRDMVALRLSPLLPWLAVYVLLIIVCTVVEAKAGEVKHEVAIDAKNHLGLGKARLAECNSKRTNIVRVALFAVAVLFVVLGVTNGGMSDVLIKAINICTECIGLG